MGPLSPKKVVDPKTRTSDRAAICLETVVYQQRNVEYELWQPPVILVAYGWLAKSTSCSQSLPWLQGKG